MLISMTRLGLQCLAVSAILVLPPALGNHLLGPMQDRLDACQAHYCPDGVSAFADENFNGYGMSLNTFISGPMNNAMWISDLNFVLAVLGYNGDSYLYRTAASLPINTTGTATANLSAHVACACNRCASISSLIWVSGSGTSSKSSS